jgi:hypothetical protein
LPTRTIKAWSPLSGHGLHNEWFQNTQNQIHVASPQPANQNKQSELSQ